MPYKLNGNCVVKTTGEVVKCHSSRRKALAHLAALKINVEKVNEACQKRKRLARRILERLQKRQSQ